MFKNLDNFNNLLIVFVVVVVVLDLSSMQEVDGNTLTLVNDKTIANHSRNHPKIVLEMCPIPLSTQQTIFNNSVVSRTTYMEHRTNDELFTKISEKLVSNSPIARDDHLQHTKSSHSIQVQRYTCSNLTRQQLKAKANLMSARNQIKHQDLLALKCSPVSEQESERATALLLPRTSKTKRKLRFHHQALPAEYLSHFEASQDEDLKLNNEQNQRITRSKSMQTRNKSNQRQYPAHENVRSWLQKIAEMQTNSKLSSLRASIEETEPIIAPSSATNPKIFSQFTDLTKATKSLIIDNRENGYESKITNDNNQLVQSPQNALTRTAISIAAYKTNITNSYVKNGRNKESLDHYNELPFMGEMTLDNYKPRRGRKPKKTDICHLIYKNYGTLVSNERISNAQLIHGNEVNSIENGHQNICENKNKYQINTSKNVDKEEEPLNLCLRDLALNRNFNSKSNCNRKIDNTLKKKSSQEIRSNGINSDTSNNKSTSKDNICSVIMSSIKNSTRKMQKNTMVTAGTFSKEKDKMSNPIALYCQQLLECGIPLASVLETIQKDNQLSLKIPIPNGLLDKTIKNNNSNCLNKDNLHIQTNSNAKNHSSDPVIQPQRRKRSAIFVPTINSNTLARGNSNTNTIANANETSKTISSTVSTKAATNQVSICKFKFTGGAKPSLLEKKMLSMDAVGNYHYFHGSNDGKLKKSPIPSTSIPWRPQHLIDLNNINSEKEAMINVDNHGKQFQDAKQIQDNHQLLDEGIEEQTTIMSEEISTRSLEVCFPCSGAKFINKELNSHNSQTSSKVNTMSSSDINGCRKESLRQVRRCSTQREKLEKTFKEQGFLIQTQQLQSAEGVTYCKFRQLKKFSRYLFRNWKDYLPEQLQQSIAIEQPQLPSQRQHLFEHNTTTKE